MGRYVQPKLAYAGFQRRGIHENSQHISPIEQHVEQALIGDSPLSIDAPLPGNTVRAAEFVLDSHPDAGASFGPTQLQRLSALVSNSRPHTGTMEQLHSPRHSAGGGKA